MSLSDIRLGEVLPKRAADRISEYNEDIICEVRLRLGRPMTVTTPSANIITDIICTAEELSKTVNMLCGGSLHAYGDTIKNGYIPLNGGGRAGVCGTFSGGMVRDITSVCIRVPRSVKGVGRSLCKRLISENRGMLIYSPPGEGKTTLLRDIAVALSSPPYTRRVSVIDSRGEIYREDSFKGSSADIYIGYPKAYGIELATRTMSPQFIICDELGREEAEAVLSAYSSGVPLIASAHSDSLEALLRRPVFSEFDRNCIFGCYVGIKRMGAGFSFYISEGGNKNDG